MRRHTLLAAAACAALALTSGGPPAVAMGDLDQGWGPVLPVSRAGADVWDVDLALDARGAGIAVWVRWTEEGPRTMWSTQRATGGWRAPMTVPGARNASEVEVGYDGRGRARLVWTSGYTVKSSWRSAAGSWSRPVLVHRTPSGSLGTRPRDLQLSMNARGASVVSWQTMDDDEGPPFAKSRVQAVTSTPSGGWNRTKTLSGKAQGAVGEVFMDRRGRATAVWTEWVGERSRVKTASRAAGRGWSEARVLSRLGVATGAPQLAGLPSGELAVAYGFRNADARGLRLWRWSRGAGWSSPSTTRGAVPRSWIDAGMDGAGNVTVAYSNAADAVRVAEVTRDGTATVSRLAGEVSVFFGMHLVVNHAGDALVAWDSVRGGDHPIEGAYRSGSGTWSAVHRISPRDGDAFLGSLAIRPDGDALAVWSGGELMDPDSSRVLSRSYTAG